MNKKFWKIFMLIILAVVINACGRLENNDDDKTYDFKEARHTSKNSLTYYYTSTQFYFVLEQIDDSRLSSILNSSREARFLSNKDKTAFYYGLLRKYKKKMRLPESLKSGKRVIFLSYSGGENIVYNWNYIVNFPQKLIHTIQLDVKSGYRNFFVSTIINLFYGLWGVLQAILMLFIGFITGTILHPIDTILTLIPSIFHLIFDTIHGIYMLFVGYH